MSDGHATDRARVVGVNHIALEVGDIDTALDFYGRIFDFRLRGRHDRMAFIDMGDQFIAIAATGAHHRDGERHFGLVVDDKAKALQAAQAAGAEFLREGGNAFYDPWGNIIQIVQYSDIQFMKTAAVLDFMGLNELEKTPEALDELREKGISVD